MKLASEWKEYKILDMAEGQKLERWGDVILARPDPQIIWKDKSYPKKWKEINATYHRSKTGGGAWQFNKKIPKQWQIHYKNLTFNIKPMGFKHTGLFPEQAVNWDWMINKIKSEKREIKVLNLFAYTGGATVACLSAGASVCHVDSSKGMTTWAKENVISSGLEDKKVRFIVDDVVKFVNREIRRGNKYDAIVMDPPSYGRGAKGEVWQFEENIYDLVELCTKVLSDAPLFFLINSYTTGISSTVLKNILNITVEKNHKGKVECGEIANGTFDLQIFIEMLIKSITNPFATFGSIFTEGAVGNYFSTLLIVTIFYSLFFFIGFVKSAPKNEYSDIEHGSSDWSQRGEQYKILDKNKGIVLAENNYLPVDKRGNVNVLVVGRIRFW